jgi:hypothetical protein
MSSFYYSEDNTTFINKFEAIKYCNSNNQILKYNYYDSIYTSVNWKTEPNYSLDYYYREQAQRIRDTYDYVVLFYSGGYDSTNILETFHYNNIKLDKVVCVGAFKQDSAFGVDENHNGELYHNSFPYLKELGLESITQVCDYSEYFGNVKNFSIYNYDTEWVEHIGTRYSPNNWFWEDIHKYVVPSNMENKRVALIWGKDRTTLFNAGNKSGIVFNDMVCLSYGSNIKIPGIDKINFYWDPNYTNILVKQLHVLTNYKNYNTYGQILYNLKKPLIYKSPKSVSAFISLRDQFLLKHRSSDIFDFYKQGLKRASTKIDIQAQLAVRSNLYTIS